MTSLLSHKLWSEVEAALQTSMAQVEPIAGGDIASSYQILTQDGEKLFVKHYATQSADHPLAGIGFAEADGLGWIEETQAIAVPGVRAAGSEWLALEWIEHAAPGEPRSKAVDERLGQQLAALHSATAPAFGGSSDNWIGRLRQSNTQADQWSLFWRDQRIAPLAQQAREAQLLTSEESQRLDQLIERIPELVGDPEPPARLHGDLWSGNAMTTTTGQPVLIDPAIYAGHREVDLAMMKLFGGFSARTFSAYAEAAPLAPGADARVPLYQVYPLLVHVLLFGRSYALQMSSAVQAALDRR